VDKDRHLSPRLGAHRILRKEEERSEEGFKIKEGWEGSFKVLKERERNRARKHQLEIARVIQSLCGSVGLEELEKQGMYTRSRVWNRRISRSDWRSITRILEERLGEARVVELDAYDSSPYCSRCRGENKDLNGAEVFVCGGCALRLDRQLNAAINLYMSIRFGYKEKWEGGRKRIKLKMEGASQKAWWDSIVLPSLVGGCVLTRGGGAEWDQ